MKSLKSEDPRFLVGLLPTVLSSVSGVLFGIGWGISDWQPADALDLGSVDIRPSWESAWVRELIADDPAADAIVAGYLSGLSSGGYLSEQQGVWVAAGAYPMAQHQGNIRRPAASLTKIATTLAALSTWGPQHQFETLVGWQGNVENGVVTGNLVIEGGNDPLFVWEEAIALANTLQQMGIRQVTGDLIIAGNFTMNFETSPAKSGLLLKQALNAAEWNYAAQIAYQNMAPQTPRPTLQIGGQVRADANSWESQVSGWLVRHRSMPLVGILKAMNIYSNNAMAEQIANTLGGPAAVAQAAAAIADVVPEELSLINGSGLGEENQMSPRAAVAMLQAVQTILQSAADSSTAAQSFTLSDIFPIVGADGGTVSDRTLPGNAVVKTGTLAVVSALAGAIPTQEKGIVWFSLLNYGTGLDNLRSRQDQIISAIEQQWGRATEIPPELQTTVRIGQAPYALGDQRRNQSLFDNTAQN